jgi:hypothetical protein
MKLSADDSIHFRTISSVLLNTTASAWVSNNNTVLPFWPSDEDSDPLGAVLTGSAQKWTANTTVYQAGLECDVMNLKNFVNYTVNSTTKFGGTVTHQTFNLTSFILESADSCSFGLASHAAGFSNGLIWESGGGWGFQLSISLAGGQRHNRQSRLRRRGHAK